MSASQMARVPGVWLGNDDLAASLSTLHVSTESKTMKTDSSNPPTPDGTGRPVNFQIIAPNLYRSSYPQYAHFEKLGELKLKTIITLVPETLPEDYQKFISENGIVHHHIPILANKDPEVYTPDETVYKVLVIMLNQSNYPMMIHCNKGKHRTGCMTASFRRVTGWTYEACIDEYERFSKPKDRALDKAFIERFNPLPLKHLAMQNGFVGGVYRQPVFGTTNYSSYTTTTVESMYTTTEDSTTDYLERVHHSMDSVRKIPSERKPED